MHKQNDTKMNAAMEHIIVLLYRVLNFAAQVIQSGYFSSGSDLDDLD